MIATVVAHYYTDALVDMFRANRTGIAAQVISEVETITGGRAHSVRAVRAESRRRISMTEVTMTDAAKNKQTMLEFYRLFYNEKRFEEGALLLTENFVNHHPGAAGMGRRGMVDDFGRLARSTFPDFRIEAKRMAADGDFVWTHNLITGLPHEGRAVSVEIWRFENGLIAEHWDVAQSLKPDQDAAAML